MSDFKDEKKLQYQILQLLPSGVGVYDVTENEVRKEYLNDGYYQMIDAVRDERHQYDGNKTVFAIHKDDIPDLLKEAHQSITEHRLFQYKFRVLSGDGSYRWIAISASHVPLDDKTERFYAAYYDVDELIRTQEKLRSNEIMFNDLLKYSDITHFTYYPDKHRYEILVVPEKLADLPKVMDDFPESFIKFVEMPEEDAVKYRETIRKIDEGAQEAECTFQAKYMGKYSWYRVHLLNLLDSEGKPLRAIGNSIIVDQYKMAEKAFNDEWVKLESAQADLIVGACFNVSNDYTMSVKQYSEIGTQAPKYNNKEMFEEALLVEPEIVGQNKETLNVLLSAASQIPDKKEREQFIKYSSHAGMLRLYESGEREVVYEYRRWVGDKLIWVSTRIVMLINPASEEVLAFYYTSDINDRIIYRKITRRIIDINYETVSYYDMHTGNMNLQADDGDSDIEFITVPYETAISRAMRMYVLKNEIDEVKVKFNLEIIKQKLTEEPVYSIYYTEEERDDLLPMHPHKRMKCDIFYLDENKDIIVFLQTNVTAIFEQERLNREKMAEALQAAESANSAKTEFLSRISHDIRTPISIITSMTHFAFEDIHDDEKLKNDLAKIKTANTYLLSLINDVLDISKIDSGKIELDPQPYPYEEHTKNIMTVLEALCNEKGIKYEYMHKRKTGVIVADRVRLNQIVLNVLSNAVKYTPPGGTVKYISDSQDLADNKIRFGFEVVDSGIGMSDSFQKVMFEPFSQEYENPYRPKGITGTGLGLSIVKRMVDLMGGTLTVKSALGKGTRVRCTIVFPDALRDPKYTGFESKQIKNQTDSRSLHGKVLLAEDNPMNMEIAERIIGGFGLKIDSAENGKIAVEKFAASKLGEYKAILMDIQMPIMNGYEATEAIRALGRPDAKTIPIIAMTADAFSDAAERGFSAGMDKYIVKPLDTAIIRSTLEEVIGEDK